MKWYWVRLTFATCGVSVNDNNIIIDAPPILRKFVGESFDNLREWRSTLEVVDLEEYNAVLASAEGCTNESTTDRTNQEPLR